MKGKEILLVKEMGDVKWKGSAHVPARVGLARSASTTRKQRAVLPSIGAARRCKLTLI